jgi:hypothetical protein
MSFGFGLCFTRFILRGGADAAVNNLETEDGFNLLLEDGGLILLES